MSAAALESVKTTIATVPGALGICAVSAVTVGLLCYLMTKGWERWTITKPWWPSAKVYQIALMKNFGYTEEICANNDYVLEAWSYILTLCVHHLSTSMFILPVLIQGWEKAGPTGQLCFYIGLILELGYDVYDVVRMVCLCFFPHIFKCMAPVPIKFFIIMGVCHHQISIFLLVPMLIHYPFLEEFHQIAFALIFAGGFSFITGSYKFTLDTKEPGQFCRYKLVVLMQWVMVLYTRVWVWFSNIPSALERFQADGSLGFYYGAIGCGVLMTLFNFALVADATEAAVKWLPRSMPTTEQGRAELDEAKLQGSFATLGRSFTSIKDDDKGNLNVELKS